MVVSGSKCEGSGTEGKPRAEAWDGFGIVWPRKFLAFDLTDEVLGFAPWEAPREASGLRMEKRPKFLNALPSGMLKIALQSWLSPISNDSNTSYATLFLGTPVYCFPSKFHCSLIFLLRLNCTT